MAFASATTWNQNSANSNYNSLQVSAERRARDLTFLPAIPTLTPSTVILPSMIRAIRRVHYGPSTFDMRHNLVVSYNWNVPFDRLLGSRRITTGWHITGISRFNSGFPINLKSGGDYALTNIGLGLSEPSRFDPKI